ncbi:MAG: hypothetical protein AMJ54_06695 [Deltaproteobacteria bacterium SG8_13]|nr:MAG: hypothetical protein AMJ54_06695 [Deltaproteobacteria bacterium SG8_13]
MIDAYRSYFRNTFRIIKSHLFLLLFPSVLVTGIYVYRIEVSSHQPFVFWIFSFAFLIVFPLIYGQFTEVILNGKITSWRTVFNKYWIRFIAASVLVKMPTILCIILFPQVDEIKNAVSFVTQISTIYIYPLVFLKREIIASIITGVKCLIGNFKFSFPLVTISVVSYILLEFDFTFSNFIESRVFGYFPFFLSVVVAVFIDLFIFIVASSILIEKLSIGRNSE